MTFTHSLKKALGFLGGSVVMNANAGALGSILGLGRSPGGGHGNPLWSSCLGNPLDRGAWWATVHGVAKSWTRLSNWTTQLLGLDLVKGIWYKEMPLSLLS